MINRGRNNTNTQIQCNIHPVNTTFVKPVLFCFSKVSLLLFLFVHLMDRFFFFGQVDTILLCPPPV